MFSAFLIASFILAVTPGLGVLYVRAVGRYLSGGAFICLGVYTVAHD